MKTIYKYPISTSGRFTLKMPSRAQILAVQMQGAIPCIWAVVHTQNAPEERRFYAAVTGWSLDSEVPDGSPYIGTFQMESDSRIFHLFEITAKPTTKRTPVFDGDQEKEHLP